MTDPTNHPTTGKRTADAPLTSRQLETLTVIQRWWEEHRYGPTFVEIAERLGPIHRSGALQKVDSLVAKGHVTRERGVHRSTMLTDKGLAYLAEHS